MNKELKEILKPKESGLNFQKDRDETLSNYRPSSTRGFSRKIFKKQDEDLDNQNTIQSKPTFKKVYRSIYTGQIIEPMEAEKISIKSEQQQQTHHLQQSQSQKNSMIINQQQTKTQRPYQQNKRYSILHKYNNFCSAKTCDQESQTQPQKLQNKSNYGQRQLKEASPAEQQQRQHQYSNSPLKKFSSNYDIRDQQQFETQEEEFQDNQQQIKLRDKQRPYSQLNKSRKHNHLKEAIEKDNQTNQKPTQQLQQEDDSNQYQSNQNNQNQQGNKKEGNCQCLDKFSEEEIESLLFDSISQADLEQMLPPEIFNNKNINLEKLVEENSEYFIHLLGQCACSKCKCGSCKCDGAQCKLKFINGLTSTYGKDFYKKTPNFQKMPILTDKMMETKFIGQQQIDYNTQNRFEFVTHEQPKLFKYKHDYVNQNAPSLSMSSYNSNFVNWKDYDAYIVKIPAHLSTPRGVPFFGRTTYQDSFGNFNKKGEIVPNDLQRQRSNPIASYTPFQSETTSMNNFQPFKVIQSNRQNKIQDYSPIPAFDGQYTTMHGKEFSQNSEDILCPANRFKKAWRKKIIQKLEQLRSDRAEKILKNAIDHKQSIIH